MIELRGVHKAFAGRPVLVDLDLRCDRGEVLFIIGTSGVGKSVTIKHLVGLLRVDAGEIWLDGRRIDALPERAFHAIRRRVAMVFQGATLFDSMTLAENVALPLRKHGRMRAAAALAVDDLSARASTRRQLRMVCGLVGLSAEVLAPLGNPGVVHYCGHRISAPGGVGRTPSGAPGRRAKTR